MPFAAAPSGEAHEDDKLFNQEKEKIPLPANGGRDFDILSEIPPGAGFCFSTIFKICSD